ncbi:MAG: ArsR family transcriptional regulator [Bacteroidales bacterium]|nr:ArsR family transcriptional regulator [Bacteroidales bacterium]
MLDTLITSKTRIKLLIKFFLNASSESYLRNLSSEFGESSNAIRVELNKFETAGLLSSEHRGNRKYFHANTNHPLYSSIHSLLIQHIGIDRIIDSVINELGDLLKVYLVGDFAKGKESSLIDLIFVGDKINAGYLLKLVQKAERLIERKIRYVIFGESEVNEYLKNKDTTEYLLLWENS